MGDWSVGRPAFRLFGWLIYWSVSWLVGRPVGRLVGRSVGQSVGRSVGRLVFRSVGGCLAISVICDVQTHKHSEKFQNPSLNVLKDKQFFFFR
jgi:hypothetical protein